jgi:hypothetical protein
LVKDSRAFVRHTIDVPLEVSTVDSTASSPKHSVNLSSGGLSFLVDECMTVGQVVHLRIPTVKPPFEADARVVWCRPEGEKFLAGVAFTDPTQAFKVRMVEQVCAIEQYRKEVAENEGRTLTSQEAATEWIQKFAGTFPSNGRPDDGQA